MRIRILVLALLLATPLTAEEKLGTLRFPTSGKAEAQAAFLRGVGALHSFWYDEAADAFREAQKIDPDFALAYWGEAMTHNHPIWQEVDLDAARAVMKKLGDSPAARAQKAPTPREQAYVAALEALYGDGEKSARDAAYEASMAKIAAAHPDDDEAKTFHALSLLGLMRARSEEDTRLQMRAAAILEPIYDANPNHPGALHYLIHSYDDPIHAPLGLRAARLYSKVAPEAFHALHMPSHIFLQLGMWDDAAASNEQSYAASKSWVERRKHPSSKRDLHSLSWLQYIYLQQGRTADAKKLIDELDPSHGDSRRERSTRERMQARYAIETGDWKSFDFGGPPAAKKGEGKGAHCAPSYTSDNDTVLFAMGMQALQAKEPARAQAAIKALGELHASRSTDAEKLAVEVMQRELEGLVLLSNGKNEQGLKKLAEAVELEKDLGAPFGPPEVVKPATELYAETLLRLGRRAEARDAFRTALQRMPNRRLARQGLTASLE